MKKTYLMKQALQILFKIPSVELAKRNEFFFPLVPFKPNRASIVVTDNCNLRCRMCNCWKQRSINELTLAELSRVLTQLREMGLIGVAFTGGEPLLRRDLVEIIRQCSALRFEEINLQTNGVLLTTDRAEELLDAGVTTVQISLDGMERLHDEIRGVKGAFKKAISGLELLSHLKRKRYPSLTILAALTLMKPNLTEVIPMANLAKELGVSFGLGLIDKLSDADDGFFKDSVWRHPEIDMNGLWIEDQKELGKVVDELHQLRAQHPFVFHATMTHSSLEYIRKYFARHDSSVPYLLSHAVINIGAQGQVYAIGALGPDGSVREKSLKEIISSGQYREKLRSVFYKKCHVGTCGYGFNYLHCLAGIRDELWWRMRLMLK